MKGLLKRTMMVLTIATILAVGLFLSALTVHATSERPMYTKKAMKVYEKRSKSSKVVKKNLAKNKKVIVYGSTKNGWVEITCPDGANGYVKKADLTAKKPAGVSAQGSGSMTDQKHKEKVLQQAKRDYAKLKRYAEDNDWEEFEAPDFKVKPNDVAPEALGPYKCVFAIHFHKGRYHIASSIMITNLRELHGDNTKLTSGFWILTKDSDIIERHGGSDVYLSNIMDAMTRY